MKVLVCGGRNYTSRDTVFAILDEIHAETVISLIINGEASGADWLSTLWANNHGVPVHGEPADWKKHGRAAGPIRNQKMMDEQKPDLVVAFPGGAGTRSMVRIAEQAGVRVEVVE